MSQFGNSHSVCVLHHKCVMLMNYFFERENDRLSSSTDDQTLLNEIPSPPQWMFNTILPLTSHVLSLSLFRKHIITLDPPSSHCHSFIPMIHHPNRPICPYRRLHHVASSPSWVCVRFRASWGRDVEVSKEIMLSAKSIRSLVNTHQTSMIMKSMRCGRQS